MPSANDADAGDDPGILEGLRILLVEDDERVRNALVAALQPAGAHVDVAPTPDDDLSILDKGAEVDLMVTDVIMPDMNGAELYLRARKSRPDLKALFISGYAQDVIENYDIID